MSSPRCYRVTLWEAIPGLAGMLSNSLSRGSQEFPDRTAAEECAMIAVSQGVARADLFAVFSRSSRKLGHYTQAVPGVPSGNWWPA